MEKLDFEMKELIEKHLPNQTAGTLKDYIESASKMQLEHEKLETAHRELKKGYEKKSKMLDNLLALQSKMENKVAEYDKRLEQLAERELRLDKTILQEQLSSEQRINANTHELVMKVFGHPRVTVTNSKTVGQPQYVDQNGLVQYPPCTTDIESEQRDEEKG